MQSPVIEALPVIVMAHQNDYWFSLVHIPIGHFRVYELHPFQGFFIRYAIEIKCFKETIAQMVVKFYGNLITLFFDFSGKELVRLSFTTPRR